MKRILFTLTLALSLISFSSFANPAEVAPAALESFETSFKQAKNVSWTVTDRYFKASFQLNGQFIAAYYDAEGKMIGMMRNISSLQLPLGLQAELKKKYEHLWISDLFEMANEEGTTYYITLENADTQVVLKSNGSEWDTFRKQRKS
jgi:hypothetical protein